MTIISRLVNPCNAFFYTRKRKRQRHGAMNFSTRVSSFTRGRRNYSITVEIHHPGRHGVYDRNYAFKCAHITCVYIPVWPIFRTILHVSDVQPLALARLGTTTRYRKYRTHAAAPHCPCSVEKASKKLIFILLLLELYHTPAHDDNVAATALSPYDGMPSPRLHFVRPVGTVDRMRNHSRDGCTGDGWGRRRQ